MPTSRLSLRLGSALAIDWSTAVDIDRCKEVNENSPTLTARLGNKIDISLSDILNNFTFYIYAGWPASHCP